MSTKVAGEVREPGAGRGGAPASARSSPRADAATGRPRRGLRADEWLWLLATALVFAPSLVSMSRIWSSVEWASHGYLVPLVAVWAATSRRSVLRRLPRHRDVRGLLLLALAVGLRVVGVGTALVFLEGLGVVLGVAGLLLFLCGSAWLRALSFPVAYLLFMVPLPAAVLTPIIVKLQLFVSTAGVALLQAVGISVLRDGNVIELPGGGSLFVAEACSGITSVITLLPLGVFLAYFTERTWPRRLLLVAAVVPLAMVGNLARVVGTVVAARVWGVEAATADGVHQWAGVLTYVLGCLALLGVGRLMRWMVPPPAQAGPTAS